MPVKGTSLTRQPLDDMPITKRTEETDMDNKLTSQHSSREEYVDELLEELSDPVHKRLIQAYQGDDPVQSMESELRKILMETAQRED
jgi:hypothetical protein